MPDVSEIKKRLFDAAKQTLEECLVVAETKVILKQSKDEDNDAYVKRISTVTEAKKKALKTAQEISKMIEVLPQEENPTTNGESANEPKIQLITPERRSKH